MKNEIPAPSPFHCQTVPRYTPAAPSPVSGLLSVTVDRSLRIPVVRNMEMDLFGLVVESAAVT